MMFGIMMCKQATRLMSKRLDAPLNRRERLSLGMHLAMCGACKQCNKQFSLIHEAGQNYQSQTPDTGDEPNDAPIH